MYTYLFYFVYLPYITFIYSTLPSFHYLTLLYLPCLLYLTLYFFSSYLALPLCTFPFCNFIALPYNSYCNYCASYFFVFVKQLCFSLSFLLFHPRMFIGRCINVASCCLFCSRCFPKWYHVVYKAQLIDCY